MSGSNPVPRGALFGLASFASFSTHDLVVKWLGETYPPTQILFFSILFGFPLLALMLISQKDAGSLRPRRPGWTALRAVSGAITAAAAFYAFSKLPMAEVYALVFAQPMLITLLAIPLLGETVGWRRRLAIAVGLVGVLIVLRPGPSGLSLAHAAAGLAAVTGALTAVIVRKIGREENNAVLLVYPMLTNFVLMGTTLAFFYKPMPVSALGANAAVAALGFVGMSLMILAYRNGTATTVAPMQYSQMIWAILFGALFFNEFPDWPTLLGVSVIILSGIAILWRESDPGVSENQPVLNKGAPSMGAYPRIFPGLRLRFSRWRNGKS